MKMKIAFYEIEDWEEKPINKELGNHNLFLSKSPLNKENIVNDCDIISVRVHSIINKEIINQFNKLRYIYTRTTGIDHIDAKECRAKDISIINIPGYATTSVAEHTFALILPLIKKIRESEKRTKEGNFSRENLKGIELNGKTIGIIGMGKIGSKVAEISKAFGMNILANDIMQNKDLKEKIGFEYVNLGYLLKNSDIITIHCNCTQSSEHLININNIQTIKKGSYIINTARGKIIEKNALVEALKKNIIAGACLDVMEDELYINEKEIKSLIKEDPLISFDNIIITPHISGNTIESSKRRLTETISQIKKTISLSA